MAYFGRTVRIVQFEFSHGRCGRTVLDRNNRLALRVLDEGFILERSETQERLLRLQQHLAHRKHFGWVSDLVRKNIERNYRVLREHLVTRLLQGKVYVQELDRLAGRYCFRLAGGYEVPVLRNFLQEERAYQVTFFRGDDPTVVSLIYLGELAT